MRLAGELADPCEVCMCAEGSRPAGKRLAACKQAQYVSAAMHAYIPDVSQAKCCTGCCCLLPAGSTEHAECGRECCATELHTEPKRRAASKSSSGQPPKACNRSCEKAAEKNRTSEHPPVKGWLSPIQCPAHQS